MTQQICSTDCMEILYFLQLHPT
uniref:Uncharacterized protein n=1 Tax=Rhizophora mucronata TaxID=61149 RepID=A0A2P2IZ66_RHIMU